MRILLDMTITLITLAILILAASAARAADPMAVTKEVIGQVMEIMNNPAYAGPAQKQQRRQMAKEVVDRHFDYREMAKRSLGATWNSLSSAQQKEFVDLFSELLEASYADKIEHASHQLRIDYHNEDVQGGTAEVRTVVVRPNDRIPINFLMLNESGTWKVYDVVIDGVSLVSNYRSQFNRIIHESSYNGLVQRLRTRVNELRSGA